MPPDPTCSRCGKPSGDEGRGYDVRKATIEMRSGRRVSVDFDPPARGHIVEVRSVKIAGKEGTVYADSGTITRTIVDCCRACFDAHAAPALIAAGFKVREEECWW